MTATLHRAPVVVPVTSEPIADGGVLVEDGVVRAVAPYGDALRGVRDARVREWAGVLTPGLVNAHTHLELTVHADMCGLDVPFLDWIRQFPARNALLTDADRTESARAGVHELLRSGTTCVADVVSRGPGIGVTAKAGLAGISYVEVVGADDARWTEKEKWFTPLLSAKGRTLGMSPHAPYSISTGVAVRTATVARARGWRIHAHVAETQQEVEAVATGAGEFAEFTASTGLDIQLASGESPVAYLDRIGVLGNDCHVAHGVHVDTTDRAVLRERSTAVALCPRSNRILRAGVAPVAAYLDEGNAVAVGTDSRASAPTLDVLDDVRELHALARAQGYDATDLARRLVEAVTVGGATAMGLDDAGRIEPGIRADLAVFDVPLAGDPYAALVEHGAGRCVATVLGGRLVHRRA